MKRLKWTTKVVKVKDLKLNDANPRIVTRGRLEKLKESLVRFDLVELPVVDSDYTVIAGNQRLKALLELNRLDDEIEVRVPNRALTERERREYIIRSNVQVGEWDWNLLALQYEQEDLLDYGLEVGNIATELVEGDEYIETLQEQRFKYKFRIVIRCQDRAEFERVQRLLGINARFIDGKRILEIFGRNNGQDSDGKKV